MNGKIATLLTVSILLISTAVVAWVISPNDDNLEDAREYDGGNIVCFNDLAVSNKQPNQKLTADYNTDAAYRYTNAEKKYADSIDKMFLGVFDNTMVFRITYIEDNIFSYLSQNYGGDGTETSLTMSWSKESSKTLESSISKTVANSIGLERGSSFEDHKIIYGEASISAEITAGTELDGGFVKSKVETTVGTNLTTGAEFGVSNTVSWNKNYEQNSAKEYVNLQSNTSSLTEEENLTKHFIAEKGYNYRVVYLSNTFVNEIVEFEMKEGKITPVKINYVVVYTEPSIVLLKTNVKSGNSFETKINDKIDCSLSEMQLNAAILKHGSELKFIENMPEENKETYDLNMFVDGTKYDTIKMDKKSPINKSDFISSTNKFISENNRNLIWSFKNPSDDSFSRTDLLSFEDCLNTLSTPTDSNLNVYAISIPKNLDSYTPITNEKELTQISSNMNGNYMLVKDITLINDWIPIGVKETGYSYFTGKLNGLGHTISNLNITHKSPIVNYSDMGTLGNDYSFTGMFAMIGPNSCINNLIIKDSSISPVKNLKGEWQVTGALTGYARSATIDNILMDNVKVILSDGNNTNSSAGLIAGIMEYGTKISDCITSTDSVVYSNGYDAYAGGIVGSMENGMGTISYCINHAKINALAHGNKVVAKANAGGITGCFKFDGDKIIDHCLNAGLIDASSEFGNNDSAGITGKNYKTDSLPTISNCAFVGNLLYEQGMLKKIGDQKVVDGNGQSVLESSNYNVSINSILVIPEWNLQNDDWKSDIYISNEKYEINMK